MKETKLAVWLEVPKSLVLWNTDGCTRSSCRQLLLFLHFKRSLLTMQHRSASSSVMSSSAAPDSDEFISWCDESHLPWNTSQAEEMSIDFSGDGVGSDSRQRAAQTSDREHGRLGDVSDQQLKCRRRPELIRERKWQQKASLS